MELNAMSSGKMRAMGTRLSVRPSGVFHVFRRFFAPVTVAVAMSMIGGVPLIGAAIAAPDASGPEWTLTAGGEYGRDDSRASLLSIDYAGMTEADPVDEPANTGQIAFGLSGLHSDTPVTAVSGSSTASSDTVTSSGQLYFRYGIEALRGGIAFNSTRDEDYRHSQQWTGMLHSGARGWAVDVDVSTRQTRFDGFPLTASEVSRQGQPVASMGSANCTLHDIGYGGTLTYTVGPWSAYGSGNANKYDNTACSYSIAEPAALQRLSSHDFGSLSGTLLDRAQLRAGGQIGQQTQLLQSQFGAGASHSWGRAVLAFDYLHAKSEFGDTTQDGYALSGTIPVLAAVAIKLTVGTTLTNSVSAPYGGLYGVVNF